MKDEDVPQVNLLQLYQQCVEQCMVFEEIDFPHDQMMMTYCRLLVVCEILQTLSELINQMEGKTQGTTIH